MPFLAFLYIARSPSFQYSGVFAIYFISLFYYEMNEWTYKVCVFEAELEFRSMNGRHGLVRYLVGSGSVTAAQSPEAHHSLLFVELLE